MVITSDTDACSSGIPGNRSNPHEIASFGEVESCSCAFRETIARLQLANGPGPSSPWPGEASQPAVMGREAHNAGHAGRPSRARGGRADVTKTTRYPKPSSGRVIEVFRLDPETVRYLDC